MYSFTGQEAISQESDNACNKTLRLSALSTLKSVFLEYRLSLGCLDGQIFVRKFKNFDRICITKA